MVKYFTFDLINHLRNQTPLIKNWIIPQWVYLYKDLIISKLASDAVIDRYTEFHDIGKPFCLKIDENGNRHFPNHAEVSAEIYGQFVSGMDSVVQGLIRNDMGIHLLKANEVSDFCNKPDCVTSLIVGLAEIHANSSLFGGLESISFKIKWKHINKKGKQILEILSKNNE